MARSVAGAGGLELVSLPTQQPLVAAVAPQPALADVLTVYIEGDGYAWRTPDWPSTDPTPLDPVALRLAAQQVAGPTAWLARPCQYVDAAATSCPVTAWTSERYAPSAVTLVNEALDILKTRYGAQQLVLVGYSGGGTVAALAAAHRSDVRHLITVAANLDLTAWTRHHGLPPPPPAHDPASEPGQLRRIAQTHLVGSRDRVVPPQLARSYAAKLGAPDQLKVIEVPEADHACCWQSVLPDILSELLPRR